MSNPDRLLADMVQWVRLREVQLETARMLRDEKRRELDSLTHAMNVRQTEFDSEERRIQQIKNWTAGPQTQFMPRLLNYLHAHQDMLADRLERCEYALLDDRNRVLAATKELAVVQQQWLQAGQRVETAKQLLFDARKRSAVMAESRLEQELDTSTPCVRSVMT
jgi:hypothetical protein